MPNDGEKLVHELGKSFEIDLNELIKNIYIAPDCADWFSDLISMVLQRYGLSVELHKSTLNDRLMY